MDLYAHLFGLGFIAAVIAAAGAGLALLNARAVRMSLWHGPYPVVPLLSVAAPALGWTGFGLYLLALMAADPTAANLWPFTLALLAVLWFCWIAASGLVAWVVRLARRGH